MNVNKPAYYQTSLADGKIQCNLCPHGCILKSGEVSRCFTRVHENGRLMTRNYGAVSSIALDPIEKKPLRFYRPGTKILSVGSFGCNLTCDFCQNWQIAQQEPQWQVMLPDELLKLALAAQQAGNIGVAYTYNEPTVWLEYVLDAAELVHAAGMANVLVTNGFIQEKPLDEVLPYLDAMNIDLKSFTNSFYQKLCGGRLEPVQETIRRCYGRCHIELTTLVIPGWNDSITEIEALTKWVASISPDIPLHLTRHHPDNRMKSPAPITVAQLKTLADVAAQSLKHVIMGNVPG